MAEAPASASAWAMFHPSPRAPLYLDVVLVLLSQDFDIVKEGALSVLEPHENDTYHGKCSRRRCITAL